MLFAALVGVSLYGLFGADLFSVRMPNTAPVIANRLGYIAFFALFSALVWLRARRHARTIVLAGALCVIVGASGFGTLFGAAFVLGSLLALGDRLTGFSKAAEAPTLAEHILSLFVGLALCCIALPLLLHLPINFRAVYVVLFSLPYLVNGRAVWRALKDFGGLLRPTASPGAGPFFCGALAAFFVLHLLVFALLPETGYDTLAMHFKISTSVAVNGVWDFDVANFSWALMPMGADGVFTAAYLLGGEGAAKLTNFAVGLLTLGLLLELLRPLAALAPRYLLAALFLLTPIVFWESTSLYVEAVLAALLLAATALVLEGGRRFDESWAWAAALLLAGAMAVKVHASMAVLPLGILLAILAFRRFERPKALRLVFSSVLLVAILGGAQYLISWVQTGNPLFPMYNPLFGSPLYPTDDRLFDTRWMQHLSWDLLYQMTFATSTFLEGENGIFGFQFLLFLPLVLVVRPKQAYKTFYLVLAVAAVYAVALFAQIQYIRYLYPVLPLFMLLIGMLFVGLDEAYGKLRLFPWLVLVSVIGLNYFFTLTMMENFYHQDIFSAQAVERHVQKVAPIRPLIDTINATQGREARVALLTDPFSAGLWGQAFQISRTHSPQFHAELNRAKTVEEVAELARRRRLTYVITATPKPKGLIEGFLSRHGRLARMSSSEPIDGGREPLALYELKAGKRELLADADFAKAGQGWDLSRAPNVAFDRQTALLVPQEEFSQTLPVFAEESLIFETKVANCGSGDNAFTLQLEWQSEQTPPPPPAASKLPCQSFSVPIRVPQGATRALLKISGTGSAPILFKRISLLGWRVD